MKLITKAIAGVSTFATSMLVSSTVFAASAADYISGITAGTGQGNLLTFIQGALNLVISLAALVAVGVLIFSGVRYIVAAGDEKKVEEATKGITFAVVGLVICFIAVIVVRFVLEKLIK
ncbi:hypothetical protein M0R04_02825 [Candidatus Dojkabacteria bacterium]|jgi:hypothetical protein|nr:hypothetical protein [Candidatus Dojkabacteria bacterium]